LFLLLLLTHLLSFQLPPAQYREMAYMAPDEHGAIPRIPFVPVEVDTIAVSNVEDQVRTVVCRSLRRRRGC